jgi:methionine sulfoxide reductase heme-binding subunit
VFVGIHVLTSVLDTYVDISWAAIVIPFTSAYGRFWVGVGAISLDLMLAVLVSSLLRARMNPATWRALHWLAYLSWPVALAHTFGMGTDSDELWLIILAVVCILSVGVALLWRVQISARQHTAHAAVKAPPSARKHLALSTEARRQRHDA